MSTETTGLSGFVYTRDIIYNRPYYMITYDNNEKTIWIAKNASREFIEYEFVDLIEKVKEIEVQHEEYSALEIGFTILEDNTISILRVTPLMAAMNIIAPMTDREFKDTKALAKCRYLDTYHILSDMAFWNPAEQIGSNPRPLDYSLYRELITAHNWSAGLQPIGYQPVRGELIQKVGNKPYISVNYTFEGLTPAGLPEDLGYKLNQYYEEALKKNKTAHSTIEQDIIFHTFDFMTDKRLKELLDFGFEESEIKTLREALFELVRQLLQHYTEICEEDFSSLQELTELRHTLRSYTPLAETNVMKLYSYIHDLLDSMKAHGAMQYVRQMRCGCIAESFCTSLVAMGYFSKQEMEAFTASIQTIESQFEQDFDKYSHGNMKREDFDRLYGHLRLGAYDIRSDSYRNIYFDLAAANPTAETTVPGGEATLDETRLAQALQDVGMKITPKELLTFIRQAKINQDIVKFEYMKSLSLILDVIARLGETMAIAREDMSYLEIQDLLSYHSRDAYIQTIETRRKFYHVNSYLVLPELILDVGDIDVIRMDEAHPDFITHKIVEAPIVKLDEAHDFDITGKIVVLANADQGYDWIFAKKIAGLVTKYGSAASHLAMRCAEAKLPAAIGCGERIYQRIRRMQLMRLDCENRRITEKQDQ